MNLLSSNACGARSRLQIFVLAVSLHLLIIVIYSSYSHNYSSYSYNNRHPLSGKVLRTFPPEKIRFNAFNHTVSKYTAPPKRAEGEPWCEQWAVMATIFEPSEAVHRQVKMKDWCLVVVGDRKSPKEYETNWTPGEGNDAVVYLSPEDQESMHNIFVSSLPWNHFGRKNVGYLYAIMHGAAVIWDFDDDNLLKFWVEGAAPAGGALTINDVLPGKDVEIIDALEPQDHSWPTYNPYPSLGAPTRPSWPRGLPLADIKKPESHNTTLTAVNVTCESIAVLQSLADSQPDVDAIYRAIMPVPFWFKRRGATKFLMIPTGILTPYNAQATLHLRMGFFALLLPITVNRRVSDIWRSYFAQRLFWDTGLQVGFVARPLVVQDRNQHDNLGDLEAEKDLYMKSGQLVEFLGSWRGNGETLVERMEELWIALYEHQYIELRDVEIMQLWLQCLISAGYKFPEVNRTTAISSPSYPQIITTKKFEDNNETDTRSLTFWTSDIHDATITDMPSVLANIGHKVIIAATKNVASRTFKSFNYPSVFEMENIVVYKNLSHVIGKEFHDGNTKLTEKMIRDNFEFYKTNKDIASVDAFLCMFTAAMCEMWLPFNKTIVFLPAHRYNLGRCTKKEWDRLNEHIHTLASMDNPKHIIGAESRYDQEYLHHYTGLDSFPLYSYSGFYTAGNSYSPKREEILCMSRFSDACSIRGISKFRVLNVHTLYPHYSLSNLTSHRAIVFIPYAVMTYKITEVYSLGIPLFMPSMKLLKTLRSVGVDRSSLSSFYCKNRRLDIQMQPHLNSIHPYSPNSIYDREAEYYWIQFADYFEWPYITYFDNSTDLEQKLGEADFNMIHNLMVKEVEHRKMKLLHNWNKATQRIETGQSTPQNYSQAIQQLYGVSRLQVY